jgi:hypothetical protein
LEQREHRLALFPSKRVPLMCAVKLVQNRLIGSGGEPKFLSNLRASLYKAYHIFVLETTQNHAQIVLDFEPVFVGKFWFHKAHNPINSVCDFDHHGRLKFSKILSSKSKNIVKENSEYLGIFHLLK